MGQTFFISRHLKGHEPINSSIHAFLPLKTLLIWHETSGIPADLTASLSKRSYDIVSTSANPMEVLRNVKSSKPHMVVLTVPQLISEKSEILRQIVTLNTTAVVILMND